MGINYGDNEIKLSDIVTVASRFTRSVNIERDFSRSGALDGYLPTPKALETLRRIVDGTRSNGNRAWTITGPYGTGKSALALFLMQILDRGTEAGSSVSAILDQCDPQLSGLLNQLLLTSGKGFLAIPVCGSRTPFALCILRGIQRAVARLSNVYPTSHWIQELQERIASQGSATGTTVVELLTALRERLPELQYLGIVLVIDELGKLLEYAALHPAESDTYVLQEIAEFAEGSGDKPVVIVGVLHQAFDQYMATADQETREEWSKVQGRYEDITYVEPCDQMMHLIARALDFNLAAHAEMEWPLLREAQNAARVGYCPPSMEVSGFVNLAMAAYPLHPSVLVALPYLFTRFSQSERSLFAYLSSREPFGMQQTIRSMQLDPSNPPYIRLPHIFDYLTANLSASIRTKWQGRKMRLALDAIERNPDLSEEEVNVIKALAVLGTLSEVSHVRSDVAALALAMGEHDESAESTRDCLTGLMSRSVVTYRRYNDSYVIWDGSDVDVEARLREAELHVPEITDLAAVVTENVGARRVVASRHSYECGAMRYFDLRFVDDGEELDSPWSFGVATGMILLCLPRTERDIVRYRKRAVKSLLAAEARVVIAVPRKVPKLASALREIRCLDWVMQNTPEIAGDRVAKVEIQDRIADLKMVVLQQIGGLANPRGWGSDRFYWYHLGREVQVEDHGGVGKFLSEICDTVYPESPRIWNELINRRTISATISSARRNLIAAMYEHGSEPRLKISGNPPELSIYFSVLQRSGIHRDNGDGTWAFGQPDPESPVNLAPVWQRLVDEVFCDPPAPKPINSLIDVLSEPPYGLQHGVFPIILCALVLSNRDEISLYREGSFIPQPSLADWDLLMKRPEMFAVAGARVTGVRKEMILRLAGLLGAKPTVLGVVRNIVTRLKALPQFARQTRLVSAQAQAVREVIFSAKSPERLLFHELPIALGLMDLGENTDSTVVEDFYSRLDLSLAELTEITARVADQARDQLLEACGLPSGVDGFQALRRFARIALEIPLPPELAPFVTRLVSGGSDDSVLDGVLAYVASTPVRMWSDFSLQRFPSQAEKIGRLFKTAVLDAGIQSRYLALSEEEISESEEVAKKIMEGLRLVMPTVPSPRVLKAALLRLWSLDTSGIQDKGGEADD